MFQLENLLLISRGLLHHEKGKKKQNEKYQLFTACST